MRPIDPARHANVGNALSETRFRLDAASTAHIVGLLTNQYSDTILAFVRELSTNAADSHISARVLRPIEVHLPSAVSPVFAVEDFGIGLSIDDLEGLYSAYGASSKREDDEVNGTLGIGSKAPLAYGDTFTVRARKGGVQVLAVVTKDVDGVPVLRILDTTSTSEPNGVRIEVPVKDRDFHSVRNTAEEFYSYWAKGTVVVDGKAPATIWDNQRLIWLDDDVAISLDHTESKIVQHNVAYPVDRYSRRLPKAQTKGYAVIAFVPTGTVNFPPSREALEYTDRTVEVLNLLDDYAAEAFVRSIRERVQAATTTYERLLLVNQWRQYVPQVVQDFFGKQGLTVRIGGHGFGWRFRVRGYGRGKASRVEHLSGRDIIGEYPIVTGYDLKGLSPKAKTKVVKFFEDLHDQYLFLPTGTNLSVAEGRGEIYTWAEIDAAVPDPVAEKGSGGYKGQTQYLTYLDGRGVSLTLKEAKEMIAEAGLQVAYTAVGGSYSTSERLPGVLVFDITSRQVDKIVRETGAVDAYVLVEAAKAKAFAALTDDDRLFAAVKRHRYSVLSNLADVLDQIADPDVAKVVKAFASVDSSATPVTLQAYINLGGHITDVEDSTIVDGLSERYPLLNEIGHYAAKRLAEDVVLYINAKYKNTEAPASPTQNQETI
jgi:hypothetical protein